MLPTRNLKRSGGGGDTDSMDGGGVGSVSPGPKLPVDSFNLQNGLSAPSFST